MGNQKIRTAIVFTANTSHVAHANLMLDSLQNPQKGNFKGDIWVISTGLSERAKRFLDRRNIKYLVDDLNEINDWKYRECVAKSQLEYEQLRLGGTRSEEECVSPAFKAFRNKRMSKLIIRKWNEQYGKDYDFIALCDNDLYIQRDINELFEKYYEADKEKIYYRHEENGIIPGSFLWKKNYYYSNYHDISGLDFGEHEINIGYIMGTCSNISGLFDDVRECFDKIHPDLLTKYQWHDQDMVRLLRAQDSKRFVLTDEGDILHLCNGGKLLIEQRYPMGFYHTLTDEKPYVLHFAGGMWSKFISIKSTFEVDPDMYFHYQELAAGDGVD